jgi:hypothetical protein
MDMNGMITREDFNIIHLGSYDFLIGTDWLGKHHAIIDYYNKAFTYLYEEGNLSIVQGIPKVVNIREVSSLQLKKRFRKGCQLFTSRMKETPKDKVSNIEYYVLDY